MNQRRTQNNDYGVVLLQDIRINDYGVVLLEDIRINDYGMVLLEDIRINDYGVVKTSESVIWFHGKLKLKLKNKCNTFSTYIE